MMNRLAVDIGDKFGSPFGVNRSFADFVRIVLTASYTIAGIIILLLLIFGGLQMIAGAGNSDPQAAARGKQAATWAVIGFVVIFVSFWIVRAIELVVGVNFITVPFPQG